MFFNPIFSCCNNFPQSKDEQETPQCNETRFSTIQPSIYVTGMKDGSDEKMMSLFRLYWLHAQSLVSIGQSKLKLLSGN